VTRQLAPLADGKQLGRHRDITVEHGKSPDTPAAIVSRGTHADGRSVTGRLDEIARLAEGLESPALLVVGGVVNVARELEAAVGLALSSRS